MDNPLDVYLEILKSTEASTTEDGRLKYCIEYENKGTKLKAEITCDKENCPEEVAENPQLVIEGLQEVFEVQQRFIDKFGIEGYTRFIEELFEKLAGQETDVQPGSPFGKSQE